MTEREYRRRTMREERRTPWLIRWLAWPALILIFLAVGYYGSGALFKAMDQRGALPPDGVVSTVEEAKKILAESGPQSVAVGKSPDVKIYTLSAQGLATGNLKIISDRLETDVERTLNTVFASSSEQWLKGVTVRHLFRNGTALYVDLPQAFAAGLAELKPENASILVKGIVRTAIENFPSLKQVKFMIEGNWSQPINGLDLSSAWGLDS